MLLDDVVESVYSSYPLLEVAVLERVVAAGQQTQAAGAFDTQFHAESLNEPIGFYENYRAGLGLAQPLWSGGRMEGGYRIGVGSFPPWYGERVTDDGGEFSARLLVPLARGRAIDERRTRWLQSRVDRAIVEPRIQAEFIEFVRQASIAYWKWVAAGQVVEANQRLLDLALARQTAIEQRVEAGEEPPIDVQDNQRLIVSRRAMLIAARQKLRDAALYLSLFLRDGEGRTYSPNPDQLPDGFPTPSAPPEDSKESQVQIALENRPELAQLQYERRRWDLELAQASNSYLPQVDAYAGARDDIGGWASSLGDKAPPEVEAGVLMSVPLQRRVASGKIQSTRGKLSQIYQKLRFLRDKIDVEVLAAINDLSGSYNRLGNAREGVVLADVMARAERVKFEQGESNLLDVNLREEQAINARIVEIEAQLDYFAAQANLRAAQGIDARRAATR